MKPEDMTPVPSPCINVCRMKDDGLCEGCLRTIDEIACWGSAPEARKRDVWREIRRREAALAGGARNG